MGRWGSEAVLGYIEEAASELPLGPGAPAFQAPICVEVASGTDSEDETVVVGAQELQLETLEGRMQEVEQALARASSTEIEHHTTDDLAVEIERPMTEHLNLDRLVVQGRDPAGNSILRAHRLRSSVASTLAWHWLSRRGIRPTALKSERWVTSRTCSDEAARCERCGRGPFP